MAGERDDEPGVLGNLPRSRPGRRSEKRGATTTRAKRQSAPAKKPAASRATAKPKPRPRPQAQPRPRPASAARKSSPDPVGQAVEIAGKVAAIGVRTATGLVKRLPRL